MRVQHNIMAMNSYRNYNTNNSKLSSNLEKLSSGYKINRAGDDAAGLAISEKMRAQITGLDAAQKNVNDGISLVKTAEGAMQEIQDMLNRMEYLADQSANGTYENEVDRENLQKEVSALKTEINRIADSSNFNGINLMDGSQAAVASTAESRATADDQTLGFSAAKGNYLTKLDFKGTTIDAMLGKSFTINGTTYEFVSETKETQTTKEGKTTEVITQEATKIAGATAIGLNKDDVSGTHAEYIADQVRTQLKTDITGGGYEVSDGVTGYETIVAIDGAVAGNDKVDDYIDIEMQGIKLQIGDSSNDYNQMLTSVGDMHTVAMGAGKDENGEGSDQTIDLIDISTQAGAQTAVQTIKNAINYVSSIRGDLGAIQNRLEHTNNNLAVMEENIQDAESTIRDTDVADEMMEYTKNNIFVQSAQAMLAQANQVPQGVLQLLQ